MLLRRPRTRKQSSATATGRRLGDAFLGGIITVLAAAAGALIGTDWFPDLIGIRANKFRFKTTVQYCKLLYFEDRQRGGKPLTTRVVGMPGNGLQVIH